LSYDVYYMEDSGRWIYDPIKFEFSPDASRNVALIAPILEAHGFAGRWAFRGNYPEGRCYGMYQEQILRLYRDADAFLNVTASQELREEHMAIPRRVYVESDPFATQIKVAQGEESTLAAWMPTTATLASAKIWVQRTARCPWNINGFPRANRW
jgi:hypothetical protein